MSLVGDEEVGDKLDRLNTAINQLMVDLGENRTHGTHLSIISSRHQSFIDGFEMMQSEFDEPSGEVFIPQEFLDKFQESLTEIDRLNMRIEDFWSEQRNTQNLLHEFYMNRSQVQALNEQLEKSLESSAESTLFLINQHCLRVNELKIEPVDINQTIGALEIENINLRSQLLSKSLETPKPVRKESIDNKDLIALQLKLEKDILSNKKKEQELQDSQEDYSYKIVQVEMLINDYKSKIEDSSKHRRAENVKKTKPPSQDVTRAKTPISMLYANSNSFMGGILNTRIEIENKLAKIETYIKSRYKKSKTAANAQQAMPLEGFIKQYRSKESEFDEKLAGILNVPPKERFILDYLKEQRANFNNRIEDLRRYERVLQETWMNEHGEVSGIEVLKKALSTYQSKAKELQREKEVIEEKNFRLNRIAENIKKENLKLQDHRKKILFERQRLRKQQMDIEKYFHCISNINNGKS